MERLKRTKLGYGQKPACRQFQVPKPNAEVWKFNLTQKLTHFSWHSQELTPEILNSFIEKIYIGETEKYEGRKMQEVEIIYKFVGAINLPQYNLY